MKQKKKKKLFGVTQILREISLREFRVPKTAILTHLETLAEFRVPKCTKVAIPNMISRKI